MAEWMRDALPKMLGTTNSPTEEMVIVLTEIAGMR